MHRLNALLMLCCAPTLLHAQANSASAPSTSVVADAADSAANARAAYRLALQRLKAGDSVRALASLTDAAKAWPQQPAYPNAVLQLALRMRDTASARRALSGANSIAMPLDASADAARTFNWAETSFNGLLSQQNALRAPDNRSITHTQLGDSLLFPEGISADNRTSTLYVSSLHRTNVLVVPSTGAPHMLLDTSTRDVGAVFGVVVDTVRNVLWVVSVASPLAQASTPAFPVRTSLLAIRLVDGKIVRRVEFPVSDPAVSPGDIALTAAGTVLVSDSQNGTLWVLPSDATSFTPLRHHLFRSLQGIVPSADGKVVWVADYSVGLLRVDLATGNAQRVADMPGHTTVGMDGMVRSGNTFVAVQNGNMPAQVLQLTLDETGTRIVKHNVVDRNAIALSPTGGTMLGNDFVYVANSLWDFVDATGALPSGLALPKPVLLKLSITR